MKKRRLLVTLIALGFLFLFSVGLTYLFVSMKPEEKQKQETDNTRFVKVASVEYSNVLTQVNGRGRVASIRELNLVSEASGKIERGSVRLKKGASFRKGQLLFSIYKDEASLMLKASKSSLLTSIADLLPDVKIDYPESYPQFNTFYQTISLDKDLPAFPHKLIEKNSSLKTFLASRNVLNQYYTVKQSELQLKRYDVYAPFSGTFTSVNFEVGAYVNTGSQVGQIIQTDVLEIEIPVVNSQSKWISIGQTVDVRSTSGDLTVKGKVVRKSAFVDPQTQMRSLFVQLDSASKNFLAGEYVKALFTGFAVNDVMEVPRSAIFNSNEMFVVENDRLLIRETNIVKLNENTALVNGISEGTQLVVEPLINVLENTVVKTLE